MLGTFQCWKVKRLVYPFQKRLRSYFHLVQVVFEQRYKVRRPNAKDLTTVQCFVWLREQRQYLWIYLTAGKLSSAKATK